MWIRKRFGKFIRKKYPKPVYKIEITESALINFWHKNRKDDKVYIFSRGRQALEWIRNEYDVYSIKASSAFRFGDMTIQLYGRKPQPVIIQFTSLDEKQYDEIIALKLLS